MGNLTIKNFYWNILKKINFKPSLLQVIYLLSYVTLFGLIIYTPALITSSVRVTEKLIIEENTIEGTLLGIMFILSIILLNRYHRETDKQKKAIQEINTDKKRVEERLHHADRYIGMVNAQILEINCIFNKIDKYPETKAELKETFRFFGERVFGMVNIKWVLFRIINSTSQRTIMERFEIRPGFSFDYPQISNKMIIEKQCIKPYTSVISNPKNLNILVFCIIPIDQVFEEQRIIIQAIINEITKLFVILNSRYYRKENELFEAPSFIKNPILSEPISTVIKI